MNNKLFALAKQYVNESKLDKALETINKCIVLNPQDKDNYLARGELYYLLEQGDNSLNDFSKVLQLDPNNSEAHSNRGIVYYDLLGINDLAMIEFNQAIQKDSKNADAFYYRGRTYRRMGQEQNALADFNMAIKLSPEKAHYYHSRGFLYQSKNRNKEAIVDFNRSIELNSTDLAHSNRAVAALRSGNYQLMLCDYYYIDKKDIDGFLSDIRSWYHSINPHKLLTNYHKVHDVTLQYQLTISQALAFLKMKPYVTNWLLQTWPQLATGLDIYKQKVALKNHTPSLPPEIYRLITSFIIECADRDIDKLVWATNKRLYDDVIESHNKKFGVKLANTANKFLTFFSVKTKSDDFKRVAEERFNRRLDF